MKDHDGQHFPESHIVPVGDYPAHITVFEVSDYSGSKVFNLKYKIANDIKDNKYPELERDKETGELNAVLGPKDKPIMLPGTAFVGVVMRGKGVWLAPTPAPDEAWKNKGYRIFFEGLGLEFPTDKVAGIDRVMVAEIEEEDVLGLPVIINVDQEEYDIKKNGKETGEKGYTMKVFNARLNPNGKALTANEIDDELPF